MSVGSCWKIFLCILGIIFSLVFEDIFKLFKIKSVFCICELLKWVEVDS